MRYTLRTLLLLMVVLAFLAAVCFAFPVWLANMVMAPVFFILPGVYVAGLIYGPRFVKLFCVGALSPVVGEFLLREEMLVSLFGAHIDAAISFLERIGRLDPTDPFARYTYLRVLVVAIFSLLSGFICQCVWVLFWKDRE